MYSLWIITIAAILNYDNRGNRDNRDNRDNGDNGDNCLVSTRLNGVSLPNVLVIAAFGDFVCSNMGLYHVYRLG